MQLLEHAAETPLCRQKGEMRRKFQTDDFPLLVLCFRKYNVFVWKPRKTLCNPRKALRLANHCEATG